ncbi:hypothetical protein DPMN_165675 [Dreissena polymorpha]|uniref:Uncharacterized protein n=1 Tax=Dreissena polymorpha TaxID=45954 RepID=A0A9D4IWM9_DREPO|nr:hypothetical protein DPMN_165675 [Dreissena polymorpha]
MLLAVNINDVVCVTDWLVGFVFRSGLVQLFYRFKVGFTMRVFVQDNEVSRRRCWARATAIVQTLVR